MGVSLLSLWAPILLGTLLAWVASALIHMLLKYHNADYRALPNEAEVAAAIAAGRPSPGIHTLPHCSDMKQMGDPALQQRFRDGPVAVVTVMRPGLPPGWRKNPKTDVETVLKEVNFLALDAWADTS